MAQLFTFFSRVSGGRGGQSASCVRWPRVFSSRLCWRGSDDATRLATKEKLQYLLSHDAVWITSISERTNVSSPQSDNNNIKSNILTPFLLPHALTLSFLPHVHAKTVNVPHDICSPWVSYHIQLSQPNPTRSTSTNQPTCLPAYLCSKNKNK